MTPPLPTPKREAWRYTNLAKVADKTPTPFAASGLNVAELALAPSTSIDDALVQLSDAQTPTCAQIKTEHNATYTLENPLRLQVEVPANTTATLTTLYKSTHDWQNAVIDIRLGENATLHHFYSQNEGSQTTHTGQVEVHLAKGAHYGSAVLMQGSSLGRLTFNAHFNGEGATLRLSALQTGSDKQHQDITASFYQNVPHTRADVLCHNVMDGKAHGIFQGKFSVAKDAQQTDSAMLCKSLLLSETARATAKPELEIYADDVKCAHGATTGHLDEEALFYLQARGLSRAQATALLQQGFMQAVIEHVADETLQKLLQEALA